MSNKARALGNNTRQWITEAEQKLERQKALLDGAIQSIGVASDKDMEFLLTKALLANSESRRLLEKTLGLGTGPLNGD